MVGLEVFLGSDTAMRSFCQVPGEVARMCAEHFKAEVSRNGALVPLLQRFNLAYITLLSQNTACNSQHSILERCARWLLLTHDRVRRSRFELTQEFIGQMLGVRRAGVNTAMQVFHDNGFITYSRGIIEIKDRAGLEKASCECYDVISTAYQRIMGDS